MLSKEKIAQYRVQLEEASARLHKEIADREKPVDFGSDVDDSSEEASEAEEFGTRLAIARVKREQLARVELALRKIDAGTYGQCDNCRTELIEKILDAAPESNVCETCRNLR
ncbi:MAG: hypothetical protein HY436_01410 [Candidatus Liptonbacteria bacterium]|nr:hypothetical protein [Candidatus Liptonbacteria bacterium]